MDSEDELFDINGDGKVDEDDDINEDGTIDEDDAIEFEEGGSESLVLLENVQ